MYTIYTIRTPGRAQGPLLFGTLFHMHIVSCRSLLLFLSLSLSPPLSLFDPRITRGQTSNGKFGYFNVLDDADGDKKSARLCAGTST